MGEVIDKNLQRRMSKMIITELHYCYDAVVVSLPSAFVSLIIISTKRLTAIKLSHSAKISCFAKLSMTSKRTTVSKLYKCLSASNR